MTEDDVLKVNLSPKILTCFLRKSALSHHNNNTELHVRLLVRLRLGNFASLTLPSLSVTVLVRISALCALEPSSHTWKIHMLSRNLKLKFTAIEFLKNDNNKLLVGHRKTRSHAPAMWLADENVQTLVRERTKIFILFHTFQKRASIMCIISPSNFLHMNSISLKMHSAITYQNQWANFKLIYWILYIKTTNRWNTRVRNIMERNT